MKNHEAVLEVRNVTKTFGGLVAVKDFTMEIQKNEILGLIGPNGAGKTTLFNVVSGFYKPDSGGILFKGEPITGLKPHEICRKGTTRTFQLVKPFLDLTVFQNVMAGAFCRTTSTEEAEQEATKILEFVGLLGQKDLQAKTLTLSSRKILEVARALATKPELLMLDELVAGLNPKETGDIITRINQIRDNGVTIFMIEHVMKAIMSLSDRIVVINHGEKIAEGKPKEIAEDKQVIEAYLGAKYGIA